MKQILLYASLLCSLHVFAGKVNDSTAIVQRIADDYKTLGNWDIPSHMNNCTDKYLLIENGELWDMKKESDYFRANANRLIDRKNYFDIKNIRVYGDCAYAVYDLRSDITENGKHTIKIWAESVILRKIKGEWKIEVIHSTPIKPQQ